MTARYGTKHCKDCGAEFAKSATDSTVRCPDCRESAREKRETRDYTTADWEAAVAWYVKAGEARKAGRARTSSFPLPDVRRVPRARGAAVMTERKYALVKIKAGDYLLLSNDGRTLWRIYRYEDGPSHGLQDMKRDVMLWGCARYDGTPEQALRDDELEYDWDRWVIVNDWLYTRQKAIDAALDYRRVTA